MCPAIPSLAREALAERLAACARAAFGWERARNFDLRKAASRSVLDTWGQCSDSRLKPSFPRQLCCHARTVTLLPRPMQAVCMLFPDN